MTMALILTIASAGFGTGYSIAYDKIIIDGVAIPEHGVNITANDWTDNEPIGEDYGVVGVTVIDTQSFSVSITNAYPCYIATVDFTISNTGLKTVLLDSLTIGTYDTAALFIEVTGIEIGFLEPGGSIVGHLTVEVLEGASMGTSYPFDITFGFLGSDQPPP